MKLKQHEKIISIGDVVFTVAIVAVALLLWFFMLSGEGSAVVIRIDGKIIAELQLAEDAEFEAAGDYSNIFKIENKKLWVKSTNCPNKQCQRMGKISAIGTSLVCAPNQASATITGKGADVDAVTG